MAARNSKKYVLTAKQRVILYKRGHVYITRNGKMIKVTPAKVGEIKPPYTVYDVNALGYMVEPLMCIHCGKMGYLSYDSRSGDALCEWCGRYQLDDD